MHSKYVIGPHLNTQRYHCIYAACIHNTHTYVYISWNLHFYEVYIIYFITCSFTPHAAPSVPPKSIVVREKGAHWTMVGWGIPSEAERNGIIISYIVQLLDTHGAVVRNETVAVQDPTFDSPQSLAHNFTSLKPYTRYVWRVAATTTAGAGPFTSVSHFRTLHSSELLGVWHSASNLFLQLQLWCYTLHTLTYCNVVLPTPSPRYIHCLHTLAFTQQPQGQCLN